MLKKKCYTCKKVFEIDHTDLQYQKIKANPNALYICKKCNQSMQVEAQLNTGLNPDMIDKHTKFLK
ncbi:DUF2197 domain-containing protein [Salirhabdus sp. Marseille-P4669]|uniref:DUF2197 domain-containing protein n=1 Tax=Salirhabdus sp. Marseille-P4669 TaxID=2042310 RepID=UPI0013578B9C|nr:DUF2197 domain-containing protein [Salirhabdus sp. Marseille-P4669]